MDTFSSYHPMVNFIYFLMVIGSSMFFMHPVFLGLSLCAAMLYSFCLQRESLSQNFVWNFSGDVADGSDQSCIQP